MKYQKYSTFKHNTPALKALEEGRRVLLKMKTDGQYTGEIQSAIISVENAINSMDHFYHRRAANGIGLTYPVLEDQKIVIDQINRKPACFLNINILGSELVDNSGIIKYDIKGEDNGKALPSHEYSLFSAYFKWLFGKEPVVFVNEDEEKETFSINAVAPISLNEIIQDEKTPSFTDIREKYIQLGNVCVESGKLVKYVLWDAVTDEQIEMSYSVDPRNEQERNQFFKANIDVVDYLLNKWNCVATGRYDRPGIIVLFNLINQNTRNEIEEDVKGILGLSKNNNT